MQIIKQKTLNSVNFKFKSFHHKIIDKALIKIMRKINILNLNSSKIISLPIKIQRYTVLRSPHIDKKSREQFEFRHHNKLLIVNYDANDYNQVLKINFLINYIKNSSSGSQLKVTYNN
jgi:small subunit ribosomal protein S10